MTASTKDGRALYNAEYYRCHCGTVPYERNAHWLAFFGGVADRIVASFSPVRVYDAGCALGFLAESLWDRGVECWGRDISDFAVQNLRPDLRPFCDQGSIAAPPPGPGAFDLATCVEVVEHMEEAEALSALDRLTEAAPRILFSSSPSDFVEATHINVKPVIYWLRQFALRGFAPEWIHNATYLAPHAFVVARTSRAPLDQELQLFAEWIRIRTALIEREQRIGHMDAAEATTAAALEDAERQVQHVANQLQGAANALEAERDRSAEAMAARKVAEVQAEALAGDIWKLRSEVLAEQDVAIAALQSRNMEVEAEAHAMRSRLMESEVQAAALRASLDRMEVQNDELRGSLQMIEASSAWRISGPVRRAVGGTEVGRIAASKLMAAAKWSLVWRIPRRVAARRQAKLPVNGSMNLTGNPVYDIVAPFFPVDPLAIAVAPLHPGPHALQERSDVLSYADWRVVRMLPTQEIELQRRMSHEFSVRPVISIIMPVYKVAPAVLDDTIRSVVAQTYSRWEFCITLADSSDPVRTAVLSRWVNQDSRIKVQHLQANLGISGNSNAALAMAEGEWIALLDHDDMLSPDALYENVRCINANPDAHLIYSDKDHVSGDGIDHQNALFKGGWSPETMLCANYLTHLNVMPTSRVREVGGWDPETDGAQDWDLFLRVIGDGDRVCHIAKVLYHWRQVPTSVASGGLSVKPYAADGQLRALDKYLPGAGWPGASAFFEGLYLRIRWGRMPLPRVSLLLLPNFERVDCPAFDWPEEVEIVAPTGFAPLGAVSVEVASHDRGTLLDALAQAASGDILVIMHAGLAVSTPDWLEELVLPLANPKIAAVAGKILKSNGRISSFGSFFVDGRARAGFRDQHEAVFDIYGGAVWYGNAVAAPLCLAALRRADWFALGGCAAQPSCTRPDLALTLQLTRSGQRLMLNPFSVAREVDERSFAVDGADADDVGRVFAKALPDGDPYVNPNFAFADERWLELPTPAAEPAADHNFGAEARHHVRAFDADRAAIERSKRTCAAQPKAPLKSVLWIVPPFTMPFYGGVHTILRAADYMLREHGIVSRFACPDEPDPAKVHAAIGRAFPLLAQATTVASLSLRNVDNSFEEVDAAICTLWTTAFSLLQMKNVRRKFYFLQDWEPLFYPAGSISGLVEATYQFGFHAITNTQSLAESYREVSGTADHFLPAIDTDIFFPRSRTQAGHSFRLFSYARPAAPRNCFETIAAALQDLKQRHGDSLDIVTAGAIWHPEAYGLSQTVRHLGLLPYAETGALYRSCDAGLVAMATRHPSYLPFELMACGAAVVTNRNIYTDWLLKDGSNAMLCELTRGDVMRAVETLMLDEVARARVVEHGYSTIRDNHQDWGQTCESIYRILRRNVE